MHRSTGLLVLLLILTLPADAKEPPTVEEARAQARALHAEAGRHFGNADYEKAADLLRRAISILAAARGEDHPDVASLTIFRGVCLQSQGRTAEALSQFQTGLGNFRKHFDGDHPFVASALGNTAQCLIAMGRAGEARPLVEESVAMRRRLTPGDGAGLVLAHSLLGACFSSEGLPADALREFRASLEMSRRVNEGDHEVTAIGLGNVAKALRDLGRADEALALNEESLAMTRRLVPPGHPAIGEELRSLSNCLRALGRTREALELSREALAVARGRFPGDHPVVVDALGSVGASLQQLGRVGEALPFVEDALRMFRRLYPQGHPQMPTLLSNVVVCLTGLGRSEEALPLLVEARDTSIRLLGEGHPDVARKTYNLAYCLYDLDRADEALPYVEKALALRSTLFDGHHPRTAAALTLLGGTHLKLGRAEKALEYHRLALEMCARLHPYDHPDLASAHHDLAFCLRRMGRDDEALPHFAEAAAMSLRTGAAAHHIQANNLARMLVKRGELEAAAAALRAAITTIEAGRRGATALDDDERTTYYQRLKSGGAYERMVDVMVRLGRPREALEYLERGRSRALLDVLDPARIDALTRTEQRAAADDDERLLARVRAVRKKLEATQAEVVRLRHVASGLRNRRDLDLREQRRRIGENQAALTSAADAQREALRERARLMSDVLDLPAPTTVDDVQGALGPAGMMLVYSVTDDDARLLVVRHGSIAAHDLTWSDGRPVSRDTLAAATDAFLRREVPMVKSGSTTRGLDLGADDLDADGPEADLFAALLPEAVWKELAKAPEIVLVPHGPLHRLPFEMLVVKRGKRPRDTVRWIDEGPAIAYAPSASVHLWCRGRLDRARKVRPALDVVALGNPVFERSGAPTDLVATSRWGRLLRLPGTEREVLAIGRAAGAGDGEEMRAKLLLADDATESALWKWAPETRILHLATHLVADETLGASYSALALTAPAAPTMEDDGFLTLDDLLERWGGRLRGCELVVLSACETQVGPQQRDEAVFAMPIGFHHAGAPAVVASLWRVDDESTAALMSDFYRRLRSGKYASKLLAFQAACRELRRTDPDPYHWAPFVWMGDPR